MRKGQGNHPGYLLARLEWLGGGGHQWLMSEFSLSLEGGSPWEYSRMGRGNTVFFAVCESFSSPLSHNSSRSSSVRQRQRQRWSWKKEEEEEEFSLEFF